jgi:myo-inositol-1(or 4)-monophosphatase
VAVRSAIIHVMAAAALKAARGLIRDFGEVEQLQVSVKGPGDFVTSADLKAEQVLRTELQRGRPGFGFLMEESGESPGDGRNRWIVDPLDGTTNFLHGLPHFAISIGCEHDDEVIAGVIYDPLRDEMFWAEKGIGAYVNDRRLRVSARRRLAEAVIGSGIPFLDHGDHGTYLATLAPMMAATAGVRRWGAASLDLAYVAAGRIDGFWEFGLKPWDIAAGLLMVREAGGYASDFAGRPVDPSTGDVLAANDQLHPQLLSLVGAAVRTPRRSTDAG